MRKFAYLLDFLSISMIALLLAGSVFLYGQAKKMGDIVSKQDIVKQCVKLSNTTQMRHGVDALLVCNQFESSSFTFKDLELVPESLPLARAVSDEVRKQILYQSEKEKRTAKKAQYLLNWILGLFLFIELLRFVFILKSASFRNRT